jgi:hypothetical protein
MSALIENDIAHCAVPSEMLHEGRRLEQIESELLHYKFLLSLAHRLEGFDGNLQH